MTGSHRCNRCGHDYSDHGRRGGRCSHDTFTEERIETGGPADGVTIRQNWERCDCPYFSGSFIPASVGVGR